MSAVVLLKKEVPDRIRIERLTLQSKANYEVKGAKLQITTVTVWEAVENVSYTFMNDL